MKKIRLLIVDDHEMVREGLRSILQEEPDLEIVGEAGDGSKALDLIDQLQPDIVLLDLKMPGMDGLEVCRRIQTGHTDSAVVAVTTFPDGNLARASFQAGARGYVLKDVEGFQLKQILRTVSSGGTVIDPNMAAYLVHQEPDREEENKNSRVSKNITDQQISILRLIGQGYSNKEIGAQMLLSENTIKSYIQDLLQKMGARNRVEAAMKASKEGWI